ncbi:MAG: hypothetical protein QM820_49255 [Minicystis sp.]
MQAPALPIEGVFPPPSRPATDSDGPPAAQPAASAVPPIPAPPPAPLPNSWTSNLLAVDAEPSVRREAARFGIGLGLAALYGLALGARQGRLAFLMHAAGVPAALLVAFGVGIPALYIFLALVDAPVVLASIAAAATRATATAGLVLAGLAPAAALFVVTSERPGAAALAAGVGLAVGGAFGLGNVVSDLRKSVEGARASVRMAADLAFGGFGIFAIVVSLRVWVSLLPVLGGGR